MSDHDTDAEPTPGTWRLADSRDPLILQDQGIIVAETERYEEPIVLAEVNQVFNEDTELSGHWKDNARIIATAGNAAGKLPDKYDPVEVIRQIPEIARLIDRLHDETHGEGDPDLDQSFRTAPSRETIDRLTGVLIGAEDGADE